MFMLHSRLAASSGQREALLEILTDGVGPAELPGCRLYVVAVDDEDPDGVWVTELWESEDAHRASLQMEAVRERIERATPILDMEGHRQQRLDAVAGVPR